jgi:hypothetical protein
MMVTGIVLTATGGVVALAGAAIAADAHDVRCSGNLCFDVVDEDQRTTGVVVALGGLAMLGAGIPLIVVGARKVPVQELDEEEDEDGDDEARAPLAPEILAAPAGAALRWRF